MECAPAGEMGRQTGVLRKRAPRFSDGVELSVRHRASSRADHYVPEADGREGAADLWAERRRALKGHLANVGIDRHL